MIPKTRGTMWSRRLSTLFRDLLFVLCLGIYSRPISSIRVTTTDDYATDIFTDVMVTETVSEETHPQSNNLRLAGGNSSFQGRVEVFMNNTWKTLCDLGYWSRQDATVVCRQLGFNGASYDSIRGDSFGRGEGPVLRKYITCYGYETSLFNCRMRDLYYSGSCGYHSEPEGVNCIPKVRLAGGRNDSEGRIEIKVGEHWGTVCGSGFDQEDADFFCRELGFDDATSFSTGDPRYGVATGPVYLRDLNCSGNPKLLAQCLSQMVRENDFECGHHADVGIACSTLESGPNIRLRGGSNRFGGRVEVLINGSWGLVCDTDYRWNSDAVSVVCRQLGLGKALSSSGSGWGFLPFLPFKIRDVNCSGNETSLFQCDFNTVLASPGRQPCTERQAKYARCKPEVRLIGGGHQYEGRLEIQVDGTWRAFCNSSLSNSVSRVICRQLGHGLASNFVVGSIFAGANVTPYIGANIECSGYENSLTSCSTFRFDEIDGCEPDSVVGVRCFPKDSDVTVRISGGENPYEGRVELEVRGVVGTICDQGWDKGEAKVVCKQLGLGPALEAPGRSRFGPGTGPIYLDNLQCNGYERSLSSCRNSISDSHVENCTHENDAGVVCSPIVRLIDGFTPFDGIVQIYKNGYWGYVCDDDWDLTDAEVVCRELNFGTAVRVASAPYFGAEWTRYTRFHRSMVRCAGNETSLVNCPYRTQYVSCSAVEKAGVICAGSKDLNCEVPPLPENAYLSMVKSSYNGDDLIAIICRYGNDSVEWRCGQDKKWIGASVVCPHQPELGEESDTNFTSFSAVVVVIIVELVLIFLMVAILIIVHRNRMRQTTGEVILMSDLLAHVESLQREAKGSCAAMKEPDPTRSSGHPDAAGQEYMEGDCF